MTSKPAQMPPKLGKSSAPCRGPFIEEDSDDDTSPANTTSAPTQVQLFTGGKVGRAHRIPSLVPPIAQLQNTIAIDDAVVAGPVPCSQRAHFSPSASPEVQVLPFSDDFFKNLMDHSPNLSADKILSWVKSFDVIEALKAFKTAILDDPISYQEFKTKTNFEGETLTVATWEAATTMARFQSKSKIAQAYSTSQIAVFVEKIIESAPVPGARKVPLELKETFEYEIGYCLLLTVTDDLENHLNGYFQQQLGLPIFADLSEHRLEHEEDGGTTTSSTAVENEIASGHDTASAEPDLLGVADDAGGTVSTTIAVEKLQRTSMAAVKENGRLTKKLADIEKKLAAMQKKQSDQQKQINVVSRTHDQAAEALMESAVYIGTVKEENEALRGEVKILKRTLTIAKVPHPEIKAKKARTS